MLTLKQSKADVIRRGMPERLLDGITDVDDVLTRYMRWKDSPESTEDKKKQEAEHIKKHQILVDFIRDHHNNEALTSEEQKFLRKLLNWIKRGEVFPSAVKRVGALARKMNIHLSNANITREDAPWQS